MAIDGPDGKQLAVVKKALITTLRDKREVKVKGGPDLDVQGDIHILAIAVAINMMAHDDDKKDK